MVHEINMHFAIVYVRDFIIGASIWGYVSQYVGHSFFIDWRIFGNALRKLLKDNLSISYNVMYC